MEKLSLEESLSDTLLAAGVCLAGAIQLRLADAGLPSDLCVHVQDGRVVVASRSAAVRRAELGSVGKPPTGLMEGAAVEAAPILVEMLVKRLGDLVR